MQPIEHTSCPDRQWSTAAYLAAMIDKRTRDQGLSSPESGESAGDLSSAMELPEASVLIWVEGDAEMALEPAAGRHRGMIVVAHGVGQGPAQTSFIISYPDAGDHAQHVPAVSDVLEAMGWAVLASERGMTDGEHVNTALLVSTASFGVEQRLWLAEPVGAGRD